LVDDRNVECYVSICRMPHSTSVSSGIHPRQREGERGRERVQCATQVRSWCISIKRHP